MRNNQNTQIGIVPPAERSQAAIVAPADKPMVAPPVAQVAAAPQAPPSALSLRASPTELALASQQGLRETGSALEAIGQGMMLTKAASDKAEREASQKAEEKAKAAEWQTKQIDYLQKMGANELVSEIQAGFITPQEGFQSYKTAIHEAKKSGQEIKPDVNGRLRYVQTGEPVFADVQKESAPLSTVGKINSDFEAGLIDQATRDALILKSSQSEGMEFTSDGDGNFSLRQGSGVGNKPTAMKESQAKANIYASRMENSNEILEKLENEGTSLWNKIASNVPLGNYALDPEYRQYDQAKRDFINATLRQESGAVIADTEFANGERQYFPQPGDDPQTIAQKKENRRIAMEAIRQASGQPATDPTFTEENVNNPSEDLDIDGLLDQYAD